MFRTLNKVLGRSDIWFENSLYMRRWRFGPKTTGGFRIHNILRSDRDRELHDHPFDFTSIILKGEYWEELADGSITRYGPGSVIHRKAEDLHKLTLKAPVWTLVFRGPYRREWGFMVESTWVPWREFVRQRLTETRPYAAESSA